MGYAFIILGGLNALFIPFLVKTKAPKPMLLSTICIAAYGIGAGLYKVLS